VKKSSREELEVVVDILNRVIREGLIEGHLAKT
jgi:hypothetical protein